MGRHALRVQSIAARAGVGVRADVWRTSAILRPHSKSSKALVRAGFVIMKYAKAEHHGMSVKTASSKSYALDAARSRGRAVIGATVKGNTVRGEACRYDVYKS